MADANKVKYGIKNVHIVPIESEEGGNITYGTPVAWKGAKSLTLDPEGDTNTYYADNTAYFTTNSNNGYSGSIEMTYLEDEIKKMIFNNVETEEGNLAEDANVLPNNVGLMFQFEGDKNATKHMFFKVVFGRPSVEGETREESIDPNTTTMDITAVPVEKDDHAWVKIDCKKGDTNYTSFFTTAPKLPTPKASEVSQVSHEAGTPVEVQSDDGKEVSAL